MKFTYPEGATPLDSNTVKGLIPRLTTQDQLNEFEQLNIASGWEWAIRSRKLKRDLLSIDGIKMLHKKMFNETWIWAGEFRKIDLNIGVHWPLIYEQVKKLCDDAHYWEVNGIFSLEEIAVRFHHKLVLIHPFPDGNGRCSRLVADLFLKYRRQPMLTWGPSSALIRESCDRSEYLASLRAADRGDYCRLLEFCRAVGLSP